MMSRHFHPTSPESGQKFRVAACLVAAVLVAGIAANLFRIVLVLS